MPATIAQLVPGGFSAMQKRLAAAGMIALVDGAYCLTDAGNAWAIDIQKALKADKNPPPMPRASSAAHQAAA